ncbi:helix-turn-helix domain-containing protein [Enterococcus faecalis]|uniref:helix-turn-helix domain-containing protein n=1 Tax=Enterococcus faecalis TaxID=1351 RepID=UPI001A96EA5D|nr:helix-turn-helix domain-containing protein [Enterococcus faecalis]MBO1137328.1 helix-turn-helix domain-containing protein [Enterococcus faecalis]
MTEKTIKELAEELGVSKTAINKKVSDENRKLWFAKIGNKFVINEVGQNAIKSMFLAENENLKRKPVGEKSKTENHKNANQVFDFELLSFLKKQLDQKDIQLQEKDEQLKQMQKLLDQQQQLTLQTNQQIKQLQKQLQLTNEEALEKENATVFENKESSDKPPSVEKKWWQFWQS